MILRRIGLENIRSYTRGEMAFPEGSLLLSGDIGCGKSTILLAVDFALFGIQKGLSGASLLRHGKEAGSVELEFDLDGRTYTIRRTLKRKGDSVRQSSASIISDGVRKELTAQEAKSFILRLLGYPEQALRRDSALMYRYTVYTPQEQMRHIIEANSDERLDIIRRLFGMDKYKRIAENAETFARELRGRVRELTGSIAGLDEKKRQHELLSKEEAGEAKRLEGLKKSISKQELLVSGKLSEIRELQDRIDAVQKKRQEYSSLRAEFDLLKESVEGGKKSLEELGPRVKELEERLKGFEKLKKPKVTLQELEKEIGEKELKEKETLSRSASLRTEIASLSKILDEGVCGTCKQKVADRNAFMKGIKERKSELEKLLSEGKAFASRIRELREQSARSQAYESKAKEKASIVEQLRDKKELMKKYMDDAKSKQGKLKRTAEKINALAREIKGDAHSKEFKKKQGEYEELRKALEETKRGRSVAEQRITDLQERLDSLSGDISKMEESRKRMEDYTQNERFLRDFFVKLMGTIERHAMVNVQNEFNSLFQKWFSMLVMDEALSARIDEDFSVLIEQNGFETEYSFMSGGERTAIALAYRLALNRVINDLTEKIKTKDLLILDEPTDGFSTEQMASVRDVLDELNTKQTIIVSHEPRVESFVDRTLRFVKENNVSRVLTE